MSAQYTILPLLTTATIDLFSKLESNSYTFEETTAFGTINTVPKVILIGEFEQPICLLNSTSYQGHSISASMHVG